MASQQQVDREVGGTSLVLGEPPFQFYPGCHFSFSLAFLLSIPLAKAFYSTIPILKVG
jgi:hypothetical protein